jgi:hypothetical protein
MLAFVDVINEEDENESHAQEGNGGEHWRGVIQSTVAPHHLPVGPQTFGDVTHAGGLKVVRVGLFPISMGHDGKGWFKTNRQQFLLAEEVSAK